MKFFTLAPISPKMCQITILSSIHQKRKCVVFGTFLFMIAANVKNFLRLSHLIFEREAFFKPSGKHIVAPNFCLSMSMSFGQSRTHWMLKLVLNIECFFLCFNCSCEIHDLEKVVWFHNETCRAIQFLHGRKQKSKQIFKIRCQFQCSRTCQNDIIHIQAST